jgi:nucleotide-binding universal stress UspA family protein
MVHSLLPGTQELSEEQSVNDPDDPMINDGRPPRFANVLVATDFSKGAARAIKRAARLPLAERATVTVVHVLSHRIPPNARVDAERVARRQLNRVIKRLGKITTALGRHDVELSPVLGRGHADVEILRLARSIDADLAILGRQGHRLKKRFVGSTTKRVIRAGVLPVLVVSRKAARGYLRPLLAVNFELSGSFVASAALRLLGSEVARATMVHAYRVPFEGFITPAASRGEMTPLRKEFRQTAKRSLENLQASLGDVGVRWRTIILRSDARTAILAESRLRRADLIAVGMPQRSTLAHVLLGSIAESVILEVARDVVVATPAGSFFELP